MTPTSAGIACMLGVTRNDLAPAPPDPGVISIDVSPCALTAILGPSGSGKSSILRSLVSAATGHGYTVIAPPSRRLPDRPVCNLLSRDPIDAMRMLASAGLADVRAMVRKPCELSEGQRARVRIALGIARAEREVRRGARVVVMIDEFGSNLDQMSARALAHLVHRCVRRTGRFACVVASSRTDLADHLAPTAVISLDPDGRARTEQRARTPKPVRVRIRATTREDYLRLASLHYRPGHPATMDRILGAFDVESGVLAGVLVVSRPVIFASWRDLAWPGRYTRGSVRVRARRINREVRCISRVIVDPRFRAMGVAHRLVRAYLRNPLTVCTEALAALGWASASGGFFAAAGMRAYRTPPRRPDARVLDALDHAGVARWRLADPASVVKRLGAGTRAGFVERELRRWASATRRTRDWRGAPLEELLGAAARSAATTPIAFAHTRVRRPSL